MKIIEKSKNASEEEVIVCWFRTDELRRLGRLLGIRPLHKFKIEDLRLADTRNDIVDTIVKFFKEYNLPRKESGE